MAIRYADIPPEKETKPAKEASKAAPAKNSPAKQETEKTDKAAPWDREDPHPEKAVTADPGQKQNEEALNKALKDTFPASDTPALTQPVKRAGRPKRTKA
ncbi:MAG: hypothetical protein ACRCTD_06320 [Beijerinckiaceae bacterium]